MEPPRPEKFRADQIGIVKPGQERFARAIGDLEADRLPGLALKDRGPLFHLARRVDVGDTEADEVAAAQFAVDR